MKNLIIFLLTTTFVFAQQNGMVVDQNNEPLPGASVVIKGTTTGTTTNFDGKFSINISQGDVLVVSYVGFSTNEVTFDGGDLTVVLNEGEALDEVLVLGVHRGVRLGLAGELEVADGLAEMYLCSYGFVVNCKAMCDW